MAAARSRLPDPLLSSAIAPSFVLEVDRSSNVSDMDTPTASPWTESSADRANLASAQAGDRDALDRLLRRHQPWIFNLALRMVWRREVAEDATQEILLRAVRGLGSFAGNSKFSTWLHRIAVNHLLSVRQSQMEMRDTTFDDMAMSLTACEDQDLPDPRALPIGHELLVEEARLGCMNAMLMCLDRRQRLAFVLGAVLGVDSATGAAVLDVGTENFRQLLARARADLAQFMSGHCGLVNRANPCRCARKASAFIARGWLDPHRLQFTAGRAASVRELVPSRLTELEALERAYVELHRDTPFVQAPDQVEALRQRLTRSELADP